MRAPREFRHTLSTLVNGLIAERLTLLAVYEAEPGDRPDPEPGTWTHFMRVVVPWLTFWARLADPPR